MALTPNTALVYDAHEYSPVSPGEDAHGHGTDCPCQPRCECGSAADAFIHSAEARAGGTTVVVRHTDNGSGGEHTSLRGSDAFEAGGNGAAVILPGRDTREGTDAYTQEPGTVAGRVDTPVPVPQPGVQVAPGAAPVQEPEQAP